MFKNKKYNWLLITGTLLYLVLFIWNTFFGDTFEFHETRNSEALGNLSIYLVVLIAVVFAPFWEEFVFRGGFQSNNNWRITSLVFLVIFNLFAAKWHMLPFTLFVAVALVVKPYGKHKKVMQVLIALASITAFVFVHYEIDKVNFSTLPQLCTHFAISFILTWVVINYSLTKSMLVHALYNFVVIFLGIVMAPELPNDLGKKGSAETASISYSWEVFSPFELNKGRMETNQEEVNVEKLRLDKVIPSIYWSIENSDHLVQYDFYSFKKFSFNFQNTADLPQGEFYKEILKELHNRKIIHIDTMTIKSEGIILETGLSPDLCNCKQTEAIKCHNISEVKKYLYEEFDIFLKLPVDLKVCAIRIDLNSSKEEIIFTLESVFQVNLRQEELAHQNVVISDYTIAKQN